MIRQIEVNSEEEWLVAVHALEVQREVNRAARSAPEGRGLQVTEEAVHEKGDGFLREILENALRREAGAKKKGG